MVATIRATCKNTLTIKAHNDWINTNRWTASVKYSKSTQKIAPLLPEPLWCLEYLSFRSTRDTLGGDNSIWTTQITVSCSDLTWVSSRFKLCQVDLSFYSSQVVSSWPLLIVCRHCVVQKKVKVRVTSHKLQIYPHPPRVSWCHLGCPVVLERLD